jgi:HEAT repeat protein
MVDDIKQSILIDEYVRAILCDEKDLLKTSVKNLHKIETAIEPELIQPFLHLLKNDSPYIREAAVKGLGEFGDVSIISYLIDCLKDANSRVRQAAIISTGKIGDISTVDHLIPMLDDVNPFVREEAANTLGLMESSKAVVPLIRSLDDENPHVQLAALASLDLLQDYRAVQPILLKLKLSSDDKLKKAYVRTLGGSAQKYLFESLCEAIEDVDLPIELALSKALGRLNVGELSEQLSIALTDEDPKIRFEAANATRRIGLSCDIDFEDLRCLINKEKSKSEVITKPDVSNKLNQVNKVNNVDHGDYITSDSGVPIWKSVQVHPLLSKTLTNHPDFLRKTEDLFSKGLARGFPRICSQNSEDARLWLSFSPLLENTELKQSTLSQLMEQAFPAKIDPDVLENLGNAQLKFWHGRSTPELILGPPSSLPHREGNTEVDLLISVDTEMIVFLEAKFHSDLSPFVKNCPDRDQAIRMIDVGSWYAEERFSSTYFIFLQFGNYPTNTKSIVNKYKNNPEALTKGLQHRMDLTEDRIKLLSRSISFVSWADPFEAIQ